MNQKRKEGRMDKMKIITENKVYVQYSDIVNLLSIITLANISCPLSVSKRCFAKSIIIDGENKYAFIEFTEPEAIKFFKSFPYFASYNELINKSEMEIMKLLEALNDEANKLINKYNSLNRNKQNKEYRKYCREYQLKCYIAMSLNDFLLYKKGEIEFDLPSDAPKIAKEEKKEVPKKKTFLENILPINRKK